MIAAGRPVPSFGFPPSDRIRTSREYRRHRHGARRFRAGPLLVAWKAGEQARGRLGMAVSRKVGKAHTRNRIKRVLRAWYRLNRHRLTASWDLVIVARPEAAGLSLRDAERELEQLVQYLNRKSESRSRA